MKSVFTVQTENLNFKEVRLVRTDEEANLLLADGWVFMTAGACHIDNAGYVAKPYFILARPA